jgi:multisubunit Na+/H+ antiporter MnhG subunit
MTDLANIFIGLSALVFLLSLIGLFRFQDVFMRLQVLVWSGLLGMGCLLLGAHFYFELFRFSLKLDLLFCLYALCLILIAMSTGNSALKLRAPRHNERPIPSPKKGI